MNINGNQKPASPAASWWNNLSQLARLRALKYTTCEQDISLTVIGMDWAYLPPHVQAALEEVRSNQLLRQGKRKGRITEV